MCQMKFQLRVQPMFQEMSLRISKQLSLSLQFYESTITEFIKGSMPDELYIYEISSVWLIFTSASRRRP